MFKIISNKYPSKERSQNLNPIYFSEKLKVETEKKVHLFKSKQKFPNFIFIGKFIYKNDYLSSKTSSKKKIYKILNQSNLYKKIKDFDGKFVIIKITNENSFEVYQDKDGQMDVYYRVLKNKVIISSGINFLVNKNEKLKFDQPALINVLTIYGFRPPKKHTLYTSIKRIGVGEFLKIDSGKVSIKEIAIEEIKITNFNLKKNQEYADTLINAVEKRSSSNGNIIYLSSGWDSTSILAVLVKLYGPKKIRPVIGRMNFSKKYGVCNPYELKKAKKICEYFNVKLEIVEFDYWRRGPEIAEKHQNLMKSQMLSGMAFYQWIDLANYVSKNNSGEPVFSGEISDGVHNFGFSQNASNNNHPDLNFRKYSDKMFNYVFGTNFIARALKGKINDDLVYNFLKNTFKNNHFDKLEKNKSRIIKQFLCGLFSRQTRFPFWSLKNHKILTAKGQNIYKKNIENYYFDNISKKINTQNLYFWYIYLYNSFHWQGGTVASLDIAANAYNFNIEFPFRDKDLIKLLSQMPENWGRGLELKPTKYPLKYCLENIINYPFFLQEGPHSYLYDTDSNFDHAAEWIHRSAFKNRYKKLLKKKKYREILSEKYFNIDYYDKIVNNYLNENISHQKLDWGSDLFNLICLTDMDWY